MLAMGRLFNRPLDKPGILDLGAGKDLDDLGVQLMRTAYFGQGAATGRPQHLRRLALVLFQGEEDGETTKSAPVAGIRQWLLHPLQSRCPASSPGVRCGRTCSVHRIPRGRSHPIGEFKPAPAFIAGAQHPLQVSISAW